MFWLDWWNLIASGIFSRSSPFQKVPGAAVGTDRAGVKEIPSRSRSGARRRRRVERLDVERYLVAQANRGNRVFAQRGAFAPTAFRDFQRVGGEGLDLGGVDLSVRFGRLEVRRELVELRIH